MPVDELVDGGVGLLPDPAVGGVVELDGLGGQLRVEESVVVVGVPVTQLGSHGQPRAFVQVQSAGTADPP